MRNAQQTVQHPGARIGGIFANRQHAAKARFVLRGAEFERFFAEGDPLRRQIFVEAHARQRHRQRRPAVEQQRQKLADFRADDTLAHHAAKHARAIARHFLAVIADRVAQLPLGLQLQFSRIDAHSLAKEIRGFVGHADLALKATANDRDVEIVHEHALVNLRLHVAAVQLRAEEIVEVPANFRRHFAANDMRPHRKAAIVHRTDDRVATGQPHVDFHLIGGLKAKAPDLDHHHEVAFLGLEHVLFDVTHVGNVLCDGCFPRIRAPKRHRVQNVLRQPRQSFLQFTVCKSCRPKSGDCASRGICRSAPG